MDQASFGSGHGGARPLISSDLEQVIGIDQVHIGRSRRHFFEKRFAAASRHPEDFLHVGIMAGGRLRGFVIARILRGEFGHKDVVAVLDAVGVDTQCRDRGIGQTLMEELIKLARRRGVRLLHSQANWTGADLLHFFDSAGFVMAPRVALERQVSELAEDVAEEV